MGVQHLMRRAKPNVEEFKGWNHAGAEEGK